MDNFSVSNKDEKQNSNSLVFTFVASLILVIISITVYVYYKYTQNPCNHITYYDVGTVDSRFNISQDDFKKTIENAVAVWENAKNKNFFEYRSGAKFKINLIYDNRQQESDERSEILSQIDTSKKGYDALKQQYDAKKSQYETKLQKYESEVTFYNNNGGAPKAEFDRLNNEKIDLNNLLKQVNILAESLNQLSQNLNLNIDQINTISNKTFEKGVYMANTIDIFEFQSNQELFITLVHEFGHALNMGHTEDPASIMYYMVTESNNSYTKPTTADLAELELSCKVNYFSF